MKQDGWDDTARTGASDAIGYTPNGGDDTTVVLPRTEQEQQLMTGSGLFDLPRFRQRVVFADALELK